ncbi:hypothetical protein G7061_06950 [Erysipelothrix sp. HDW6B]|uniref:hypothetical protein n=1 Tax=Erysipelothrix TaxID=1647 RepID=UPI0013587A0E|nr:MULTISPECIES: hypothetical protein [Erysipelothrix]QIK86360.1 hypothetical protein G7061_06950 [Erysipelothrix sp. HDW6B]
MTELVENKNTFFDKAVIRLLNSNWDGTLESAKRILQFDGAVLNSVIAEAILLYGKTSCEQICSQV